jgi:hypothetical protein
VRFVCLALLAACAPSLIGVIRGFPSLNSRMKGPPMFGIGIVEMAILAILGLGTIVGIVAAVVVASSADRGREKK